MSTPSFEPAHFLIRFSPSTFNEILGGNSVDLVGYKQWSSFTCGFASVAMVLSHFRPEVDLVKLYEELGTTEEGTGQTAIVNTLRNYGLSVSIKPKTYLDDIKLAIDNEKLLIIYDNVEDHWMVVYGYQNNGLVLVADPGPCGEYLYPWYAGEPFNRFSLVISEKGRRNVVK